jgi:hypothetical protein
MTIDRSKPVVAGNMPVRSSNRMNALLLTGMLAVPLMALPVSVHAVDAAATKAPALAKLPKGFSHYGTTPVAGGGECVTGDSTKEGMDGRAVVYVDDPTSHQIKWIRSIPLPPRRYQNRATHCFAMGDSLFVLVQTDTHQQTSLSQTLLSVIELSAADGAIKATRDEELPGIDDAYSAWVDKGNAGFHEEAGKIKISGKYFLMDHPDKRIPFTMTVPPHESN